MELRHRKTVYSNCMIKHQHLLHQGQVSNWCILASVQLYTSFLSYIHSVWSSKCLDSMSATTFRTPGKWSTDSHMCRSWHHSQIWIASLLHWTDLVPPIWAMHCCGIVYPDFITYIFLILAKCFQCEKGCQKLKEIHFIEFSEVIFSWPPSTPYVDHSICSTPAKVGCIAFKTDIRWQSKPCASQVYYFSTIQILLCLLVPCLPYNSFYYYLSAIVFSFSSYLS